MTSEHNSSISGMAHLTFLSPSHLSPKDDAAAAAETCSNQWIYDISTRVVYPLQVECFGFSLLKRTNSNVIHIVDGRMKKRFGLQQGCRKIRIFIRTPPHSSPAISIAIQRRNVEEKMNIKSATATWWCSTISTFFFRLRVCWWNSKLIFFTSVHAVRWDNKCSRFQLPLCALPFSTMWI